jgi:hypothetical protein
MNCGGVLDEKISLVHQGSHLDDSPAGQVDQAENAQVEDDQELALNRNVNLTAYTTTVLESQVDDSALPQQEPTILPVGDSDSDLQSE